MTERPIKVANGGESRATIPDGRTRALWLAVLQALAMMSSAIREYVGARGSCDKCGRTL